MEPLPSLSSLLLCLYLWMARTLAATNDGKWCKPLLQTNTKGLLSMVNISCNDYNQQSIIIAKYKLLLLTGDSDMVLRQ